MSAKTISALSRDQAFTKLLDDKENGLDPDKRRVWRSRHKNGGMTDHFKEFQLKAYGYKEVTPGNWV